MFLENNRSEYEDGIKMEYCTYLMMPFVQTLETPGVFLLLHLQIKKDLRPSLVLKGPTRSVWCHLAVRKHTANQHNASVFGHPQNQHTISQL